MFFFDIVIVLWSLLVVLVMCSLFFALVRYLCCCYGVAVRGRCSCYVSVCVALDRCSWFAMMR